VGECRATASGKGGSTRAAVRQADLAHDAQDGVRGEGRVRECFPIALGDQHQPSLGVVAGHEPMRDGSSRSAEQDDLADPLRYRPELDA
jgi:hypothetical protein